MKKKLLKGIKNLKKHHKTNINIFVVCISIVMIWRGVRDLLDMYLLPNHPVWSNIICIVLGVVILLLDDGRLGELEGEPHKTQDTKK